MKTNHCLSVGMSSRSSVFSGPSTEIALLRQRRMSRSSSLSESKAQQAEDVGRDELRPKPWGAFASVRGFHPRGFAVFISGRSRLAP
jgi:hypothetical protein